MYNKILRISLLMIIVVIFILTLTGCINPVKLETPSGLNVEGNLLSWVEVPDAVNYRVSINNVEYMANTNEYYILVDGEEYEYPIQVKALGDNKKFLDSDYSAILVYIPENTNPNQKPTLPRLIAPTGLNVTGGILTWNASANAVGYRVRIINPDSSTTFHDTVSRSFTLVGSMDGVYQISIMALANSEIHTNSNYSAPFSYEVRGEQIVRVQLRPPLQITFSNGKLNWSRVSFASGYIINIDDVDEITINNGMTTSHDLGFTDQRQRTVKIKAIGDDINYRSSIYSTTITFPLSVSTAPIGMYISEGQLHWEKAESATVYRIAINGDEVADVEDNYYPLDFSQDGLNAIKVKAIGDKIYYTDSPYSAEIGYRALDGDPVPIALQAPVNLSILDNGILTWDVVPLATSYEVMIDGIGSRINQGDRLVSVDDLGDGVFSISVKARGDNVYTSDSPYSMQLFYIDGDYVGPVLLEAPKNIRYVNGRVEWDRVQNAHVYEVLMNDEPISDISTTYLASNYIVELGIHVFRVRAIGEMPSYGNSPYSEELIIEKPMMLDTPSEIFITGTKLIWSSVVSASAYEVEIRGGGDHVNFTTTDLYYDIDVEFDGVYIIRVKAKGDQVFYYDSLYTQEVYYIKLDGSLGGQDNPYLIETAEDLDLIRYNPSSYFLLMDDIDLEGIDFEPLCSLSSQFSGHLDGNGYTISNINITGNHIYAGLFAYINGGTVINLNIDTININVDNYLEAPEPPEDPEDPQDDYTPGSINAGALSAYARNATINNIIVVNATLILNSNSISAGLLIGNLNGNINDIEVNGSITATSSGSNYVGGVAGYVSGNMENIIVGSSDSRVTINVSSDNNVNVGGLAGRLQGTEITGAEVFADIVVVEGLMANVGGLSGIIIANQIQDVDVDVNINANVVNIARVGGIAGTSNANTQRAVIKGSITLICEELAYVGGLLGINNNSLIEDVEIDIIIEVSSEYVFAAGLMGQGRADIVNADVNGSITINSTNIIYVGGIAGSIIGDINNAIIDITITSESEGEQLFVGGIAGTIDGDVSNIDINSSITAEAINNNVNAGGAVGYYEEGALSDLTINATIEVESLNGVVYSGGVAGVFVHGSINNVDALNVNINALGSGSVYAGGIVGSSDTVINNATSIIIIQAESTGDLVYAGGITGYSNKDIILSSSSGEINVLGAGIFAGGIAGFSKDLSEVEFTGNINGTTVAYDIQGEPIDENSDYTHIYIGGIAGRISGDIDEATATIGSLTANSLEGNVYIGGISGMQEVGENTMLFINSTGSRLIEATANNIAYAGGVAGFTGAVYKSLYDEDVITSYAAVVDIDVVSEGYESAYAGGFAGSLSGIVDGVITQGSTRAMSNGQAFSGGIVGNMEVSVLSNVTSSNEIAVSSNQVAYAGGIAGAFVVSNISHSAFDGTIIIDNSIINVGGIAGYGSGDVTLSYTNANYSPISSDELYLGGLIGYYQEGLMNRCYSIFNVNVDLNGVVSYIGGLAGYINNASTVNSYSVVDITAINISDDDYIGGISGINYNGSVSYCYVTGGLELSKLTGSETPFVGNFLGANNSVINMSIYDSLMLGGLSGIGNGSRVGLTPEIMGASCTDAGYEGWDSESVWTFANEYYPRLQGLIGQDITMSVDVAESSVTFYDISEEFDLSNLLTFTYSAGALFKNAYYYVEPNSSITVTADGWVDIYYDTPVDGVQISIFFEGGTELNINVIAQNVHSIGGDGTELLPYVITSREWMRYLYFRPDAHFILQGHIDLSGESWIPVGTIEQPFTGSLNGNHNTITGLTNPSVGQYLGLFGYTEGASVSNLTIQGININSESPYGNVYAGSLIGYAIDTDISNVTMSGIINARAINGNAYVGGIVGYGYGISINNASVSVDLDTLAGSSECMVGGVAGYYYGAIERSYYKGALDVAGSYGTISIGGLVGHAIGTIISESYASLDIYVVTSTASINAGGLAGNISTNYSESVSSYIEDTYSSVIISINSISQTGYIGGLVGINESTINRSYSVSHIPQHGTYGAFVGFNIGSIQDSYYYKNDDYHSTGVGGGSNSGFSGVSAEFLMNGNELNGWDNWSFELNSLPRITGLSNQNVVTSVSGLMALDIDTPSNLINLLDYITYDVNYNATFKAVVISAISSDVLAIIDGTYAAVMGDGIVELTLLFDGGLTEILSIEVINAPAPLFAGGRGVQSEPFVIVSIEQLDNVRLFKDFAYILGSNLDLSSVAWTSIGTQQEPFTGYFDGDNYTISNITGESIFGYLNDAEIRNISIVGADTTILATDNAGLIAIRADYSVIDNIVIDTTSTMTTDAEYIGGIVGYLNYSEIINSSNHMNISVVTNEVKYIGGLVGRAYYSTLSNNTNPGLLELNVSEGTGYLGGFVGYAFDTVINNSVATINLQSDSIDSNLYVGGLVGYGRLVSFNNNSFVINVDIVNNSVIEVGSVNIGGLSAYAEIFSINDMTINFNVAVNSDYSAQIAGLIINKDSQAISLEDITTTLNVTGNIGDGLNIGGMVIGNVSTVQDVTTNIIIDVDVVNDVIVGGIADTLNGDVNNASMTVDIDLFSSAGSIIVGGVAGISNGNISNVSIDGAINTESVEKSIYIGGVVGMLNQYKVINNVSTDIELNAEIAIELLQDITTDAINIYAGGLAGISEGVIEASSAVGDINVIYTNDGIINALEQLVIVGGLIGESNGSIETSYYKGDIGIIIDMGEVIVGGLVGRANSNISKCYSAGLLTITSAVELTAGGLVGFADDIAINDCYSSMEMNINSSASLGYTGGLIGVSYATVNRAYSASINNTVFNYGQLIGNNLGENSECFFPITYNLESTGVYEGNSLGIERVSATVLMSGDVLAGWDNWTFAIDNYPKLDNVGGQGVVSSVGTMLSIVIDSPAALFSIYDYISYTVNAEATISTIYAESSNTSVLAIIDGVFGVIIDNGITFLTLVFDGGYDIIVEVTISNSVDRLFAGGEGSELNPFLIEDEDQLQNMEYIKSAHYKLNADIDLTGIIWSSIGNEYKPFRGVLDGNNRSISNLDGESLFDYIYNAEINNLNIVGANVEVLNKDYAGIFANKIYYSTIDNCSIDVTSSIDSDAEYIGGMVGLMDYSTISNSTVNMPMTFVRSSRLVLGGIVGSASTSTIDNCAITSTLEISITDDEGILGGFVGEATSTNIINSISNIDLIASSNADTTTSSIYVGGLVGRGSFLNVDNNEIDVTINASGTNSEVIIFVGGMIGEAIDSTISDNDVDVSVITNGDGTHIVGGLSGSNGEGNTYTDIIIILNVDVTTTGDAYIGGVVGGEHLVADYITLTFTFVSSVTGDLYCGALIAILSGEYDIDNISATGTLNAVNHTDEIGLDIRV